QERMEAWIVDEVNNGAPLVTTDEWTQFAHDAARTGFTAKSIPTPWRWKWSWNGPTATGTVSAGKIRLPRNVQPVTGGGRVYIAAGANGVYALNVNNGSQAWHATGLGDINSTPAYDPSTASLFVVSANGYLYRLNASTGAQNGEFNAQATSTLALPPAISGSRVYFSMGSHIFAVNTGSMSSDWAYDAGSPVQTPPSVSTATGLVVAASEDLYVHAVHVSDGTQDWRVKPTSLTPGDPASSPANSLAEVKYGWPVIAEGHGLVLVRYRLDWDTLYTWTPWPGTNAAMRTNLTSKPSEQSLFALRLTDGGMAFISNVGNGGFGDGGRLNIGPPPVIKRFADGSE
ncbi:MAG TPA: PQQ-binding-like beta-propeller repeat protein, partial [Anaerolinea sp.]|nr:PQQ-binding-like beta-propeller repeat protein [Anaerolinea sp.]